LQYSLFNPYSVSFKKLNKLILPMKTNHKIIMGIVIVAIILTIFLTNNSKEVGKYDDFAKCVTENGAKLYGAYWCPHCNEQKEMFGKSINHINYIECSLPNRGGQTQFCRQEGIEGYPTWEFQDETRQAGKLSFEELSQKTGCNLE